MKIIAKHCVDQVDGPIRFQEFGVGIFPQINTRSALKKAVKRKQILINDFPASTAHMVKKGDVIALLESKQPAQRIYHLDLKIWYEDDYLAVVQKPSGIAVSGNKFATLTNALLPHLKASSQTDATLPHPVHRLDYATSGLLVIGKTLSTRQKLHTMFQLHQIEKMYHAVCVKTFLHLRGTIDQPLAGKEARTAYEIIQTVKSKKFDALNLVALRPLTGRTHQLRKHMMLLGNPIMGDQKYHLVGYEHSGYGLYLHASELAFVHPITHEALYIQSPLPKKFKRIFELT